MTAATRAGGLVSLPLVEDLAVLGGVVAGERHRRPCLGDRHGRESGLHLPGGVPAPGRWGTRAPLPEGARWGLDSLLLALQATADPAVVNGRYELRLGTDVFTVDGTSGSVRMRRGTADKPDAVLTTDAGTLHAVALGTRPIAGPVESGDLRLDGDPQAIGGLTGLLQALTGAA